LKEIIRGETMQLKTHLKIDTSLNGEIIELKENYAKVQLTTSKEMIADAYELVHGGFVFGAGDFTAMATINHPNVVLAKSEAKFVAPVKLGDIVIFEGELVSSDGFKGEVAVEGKVGERLVFKATFYTASLKNHLFA